MKRISTFSSMIFILFLLLSPFDRTVLASERENYIENDGLRLISSASEAITFEVKVPVDKLIEERVRVEDNDYLALSIPGWSQTALEGEPVLPKITGSLGIPFGADYELQVVPGRKSTRILQYPVLPGGTQSIDWEGADLSIDNLQNLEPKYKIIEDKGIYESDKPYPGPLAEVTADGILRQQRVIGVSLYPIQYLPGSSKLIVYETIRVTITFSDVPSTRSQSLLSDSTVYEDLLEGMLLNYDSAKTWREEPGDRVLDSANRSMPWTPPDPGWRVLVREEGFYQLGYDELASAGLPVDTIDPGTFQLFHQGSEVAIHVEGEDDSAFDSGDTILFYGLGIDSKYTSDNVYWLTYGGSPGVLRMGTRDVTPGSAETPSAHLANIFMEENNIYRSTAPGDESLERWFWDYILATSPQTWQQTITIPNYLPVHAKVEIMLLGNLRNAINPDHHVKVYIQNTSGSHMIGEAWWDGINWEFLEIIVEPGVIQAGDNTIIIECPIDTGVGADWVFIDWINLGFSSSFTAIDDQLAFSYEEIGSWKYEVGGFTADDVLVYDVTDSNAVVQLTGGLVEAVESEYTLQFEDNVTGIKNYWTRLSGEFLSVHGIEEDTFTDIQDPSNAAEHLIITHEDFAPQADALRLHREDHDLDSMVVDVQDIYDVFNFGIVDVNAIRDFLGYTIDNWDVYPSFVLLIGDGHYNPKAYNLSIYNNWQESFIPPYLAPVDSTLIETAADNRYVTLVGDDLLPDMMLGRLAVNNSEEANAVVSKIVTYETNPPTGDWRQQILAVTDNPDDAGNFYYVMDNLINCCLPEPFTAEKVYFKNTHLTEAETRTAIQDGINTGKLIINYIGHASTSQWADEGLFKRTDIAGLSNGDKLPIMLPMTCMDGYYINPGSTQGGIYPSIAETITRVAGKGAIASWSPTGWGNVSGHDVLNRAFYNAVFQSGDGMVTIGSAAQEGNIALFSEGTNQDLLDTYLLFGDPATRILTDFTAVNDNYTVEEDTTLVISDGVEGKKGVLMNDLHPENSLITAVLVDNVANGELMLNSDGSFSYSPDPDYFGMDSFTYYATDGEENSNIALVEIMVTAVDEQLFLPLIMVGAE